MSKCYVFLSFIFTSSLHSPIFNATFAQQNPAKPLHPSGGNTLLGDFTLPTGNNHYTLGGPGQNLSGPLGDDGYSHGMNQALMDDRNARSYASWLAWWKNTVSSEDYIKYLSTQVRALNKAYPSPPLPLLPPKNTTVLSRLVAGMVEEHCQQ